jgi:N-acetylglucosamine-6-sulfatase
MAQRVPLMIRGPGVARGTTRSNLVTNLDWVPTIADWANASTPSFVDGRPIGPIIANAAAPWRSRILSEVHVSYEFYALRDANEWYVEYTSGEREYYNLSTDPYQLDNAYGQNPVRDAALSAQLNDLRTCPGTTCRTADGGP